MQYYAGLSGLPDLRCSGMERAKYMVHNYLFAAETTSFGRVYAVDNGETGLCFL